MRSLISYFRSHSTQAVTAVAVLTAIMLLIIANIETMPGSDNGYDNNSLRKKISKMSANWGGAIHPGFFKHEDSIIQDNKFTFAAVTDLDELGRMRMPGTSSDSDSDSDSTKLSFHSFLVSGQVEYDSNLNKYQISFEPLHELVSGHNFAGRGMELSELILYENRLLAFDDKTGSIFEILSKSDNTMTSTPDVGVVPRFVITEGEGDTDKGMKWEWATEKDGNLYIGSMGKEYTAPDGSIVNTNNLWIAIVNKKGEVRRIDWTKQYNFVREQLGASAPGYVIHEAVLWSEKLKKWIFIPRRISSEMYNDVKDERRGSNKVLLVNEAFTDASVVEVNMDVVDPLHGFSTAAFVPNTDERHIMAIRSVEEDCVGGDEDLCKQRSYMVIFDVLTGEVLMDEVKFEDDIKFEGVEFVNIHSANPY